MPRLHDRLPRGFVKADYAEWLGAIFSRFLANSARKPTLSKPVRRSSALGIDRDMPRAAYRGFLHWRISNAGPAAVARVATSVIGAGIPRPVTARDVGWWALLPDRMPQSRHRRMAFAVTSLPCPAPRYARLAPSNWWGDHAVPKLQRRPER